ncbi:hypothetical protein [Tateyamaria sp.]|uniref:hypothetical protein n=1 Tax=Tateyamaria sp. TaxID=1929288 RepID=UPI0032877665
MLIAVKKRFVFVANSKTASTSIDKAIMSECEIYRGGSPQNKHIFLRQAIKEYDFLFGRPKYAPSTFFKFGIIREPLSWVQSWYRYRLGNGSIDAGMTFQAFWDNKAGPAARKGKRMKQSNFFTKHNGELLIDYLIPYEDLAAQFEKIGSQLGIQTSLPHKNKSAVEKISDPISDELVADIRTTLASDFDLYDRVESINKQGWQHLLNTRPTLKEAVSESV